MVAKGGKVTDVQYSITPATSTDVALKAIGAESPAAAEEEEEEAQAEEAAAAPAAPSTSEPDAAKGGKKRKGGDKKGGDKKAKKAEDGGGEDGDGGGDGEGDGSTARYKWKKAAEAQLAAAKGRALPRAKLAKRVLRALGVKGASAKKKAALVDDMMAKLAASSRFQVDAAAGVVALASK